VNLPVWCADLAARFWETAGAPPAFARDLRGPAAWFPFAVVELPGLRLAAVSEWLAVRGCRVPEGEPDRPLRGCLFADLGRGYAFLDASDEANERRFSLAHELGHFLRDYWHPREVVAARLGPGALEVLDGLRPPTREEQLHALLRNAAVGPFTHLLRRDESGRPLTPAECEAEVAADRLAFELLAPASGLGAPGDRGELVRKLIDVFGLPPAPAERYAALLVPERPDAGPLVRRVRTS
jgi:hypothetical protein